MGAPKAGMWHNSQHATWDAYMSSVNPCIQIPAQFWVPADMYSKNQQIIGDCCCYLMQGTD